MDTGRPSGYTRAARRIGCTNRTGKHSHRTSSICTLNSALQVFLCIAHLILGRQLEELSSKVLEDGDWEIMTETLEMLIGVFHERMQSLLRGWRAQKLNVELHITCFAGGIYNGWYSAVGSFVRPQLQTKTYLSITTQTER